MQVTQINKIYTYIPRRNNGISFWLFYKKYIFFITIPRAMKVRLNCFVKFKMILEGILLEGESSCTLIDLT